MFRKILLVASCCFITTVIAGQLIHNARASDSLAVPNRTTIWAGLPSAKTLCGKNEQVVFSCSMQKSGKLLSICSSKQVDGQNGYVQYRFGLPGKVELEFPSERKGSQSAFAYSRYTRPLVTLLTLQFESNGYKYFIHQDSNAEEKPPIDSSSVNITSPDAGAKEIEMTCREPVKGNLMLLEDIVPKIEE